MYDKAELQKGIKHETEHTADKALATKIAVDHLLEDPHYYTKLEKSGLEECGEVDVVAPVGALSHVAPVTPPVASTVAVVSIGSTQPEGQTKLTSSGLGNGAPKPLKSDKLEAPEDKKVGANKVATTKTPPMAGASSITTSDPLDYFGGQIGQAVSKW